ncbi:hypothetical protein HDU93_008881, partial [Gonapodya sp. JEL0774]
MDGKVEESSKSERGTLGPSTSFTPPSLSPTISTVIGLGDDSYRTARTIVAVADCAPLEVWERIVSYTDPYTFYNRLPHVSKTFNRATQNAIPGSKNGERTVLCDVRIVRAPTLEHTPDDSIKVKYLNSFTSVQTSTACLWVGIEVSVGLIAKAVGEDRSVSLDTLVRRKLKLYCERVGQTAIHLHYRSVSTMFWHPKDTMAVWLCRKQGIRKVAKFVETFHVKHVEVPHMNDVFLWTNYSLGMRFVASSVRSVVVTQRCVGEREEWQRLVLLFPNAKFTTMPEMVEDANSSD